MKERKIIIGLVLFVVVFSVFGGAGVSSGEIEGGNGIILSTENSTNNTVIWIHNVYELQNMSNNLSGRYALANDINASITKTWNGGSGFAPIGTPASPFNGTFDGKGHKIINLSINRSSQDYVGLFGYTSSNAVIENVGLENVTVWGANGVGGLVGMNVGTINNSYATGNVSGRGANVGGLIGYNGGTVSNSYATGNVSGSYYVGGLVGYNYRGTVSNSYATGNVSGGEYVGGLVGYNGGTLSNCYAIGDVSGDIFVGGLLGSNYGMVNNGYAVGDVSGGEYVGGLVGDNSGTVSNSYATGNVSGGEYVGGLVGWNGGTMKNSHYNVSKVLINGGHYLTIGGLFDYQYNDWFSHGLHLNISDYSSTLIPAGGYYLINSVQGLKDLLGFADMNYKFRLAADLDLSSEPNLYIPYFAGEFDGNNHTVSNLNINIPFAFDLGLFGDNKGTVKNVGAVNVSVIGGDYVGGLVGGNSGTVSNSYASGNVSGDLSVGGLVGDNWGAVIGSCVTGNVSGHRAVGGLVGYNYHGTVRNSYAMDNVSGGYYVGGLVGYNYRGTVSNCYATGNVSGDEYVGGLVGYNGRYVWEIIGGDLGMVSSCYATGDVSGGNRTGGLVGYNYWGTVSNSYASGNVSGDEYVGGLVGYNEGCIGSIRGYGWVKYAYAAGRVNGLSNVGGLIGYNVMGTIISSFWDINTTGQTTSAGGTGKTTDEMKNKTTFTSAGWDFTNIWDIWEGRTYPFFKWQDVKAVPLEPLNLSVRSGDGYVNLSWEKPLDDGGSPIIGYRIYRGTSSGDETYLAMVGGNVTTYNDTGVTNGQRYYYCVSALNVVGEGELSEEVNATPLGVPSAPQNLVARGGDGYVVLTWEAPADDGGSPITGYKIYRGTRSGNEVLLTTIGNETTYYNDTGVMNGQRYYYRVSALNVVGEGELSEEVSATPQTVPSAPRNLVAREGDGYVVLTWEAPADDGGSPIVGYKIYRGTSSGDETYLTIVGGNATTYNDTGLRNGQRYYYRVSALNGVGESELSEEVSATPLGMPTAPQNLMASAGEGYVVLTWEAPADDGGSSIIKYKIYRGTRSGNEVLLTTVGNVLTYNDTGVTNGQIYYYRVSALNVVGEGELSEEVSALPQTVETPQTVPSAPRNLVARGGDRYVVLTWEAPADDGGSPIIGYKIYRGTSPGNETLLIIVGNVLTYNDTGLMNGQTYYYRVSALNGVGVGELSEEVSATPQSAPTPAGTSASGGWGSLLLLAALVVVIVTIALIVLFARWRKGESGESQATSMEE